MVKELHKRSAHVDVPVDKVFDYLKDPLHFWEAWDEEWRRHMAVAEVKDGPGLRGSGRPSGSWAGCSSSSTRSG